MNIYYCNITEHIYFLQVKTKCRNNFDFKIILRDLQFLRVFLIISTMIRVLYLFFY